MKCYEVKYSPGLEVASGNLLTEFAFPWLPREAPSTQFRAVWNESTLAFRFDVIDDDVVLGEADTPAEGVLLSDRVELFFAQDRELELPYYAAEMDPGGRVYDYQAKHYREFDTSWSFSSLTFTGEVHDLGYAVTGRFDLAELRDLGVLQGAQLIAGAYRAEFSMKGDELVQDWISWINPRTPSPDFHVPTSFGSFELVK